MRITIDADTTPVAIPSGTPLGDLAGLINNAAGRRFSAAAQPGGICLTSTRVGSSGRMDVDGIDAAHLTDQNGDVLDAVVRVNGQPVATTDEFVTVQANLRAKINAAGSATVTSGQAVPAGGFGQWVVTVLGRRQPSGPLLLYRTLKWQSWAGILLVVIGGVGGMYFGTNQGSVKAQTRALDASSAVTTTSMAGTATTTTTTTTTTLLPPVGPPTAAGPTSSTTTTTVVAATSGGTGTATTPGGTTSSTVSLVQAIALAMVAAGATMIPTGAIGVLAAKVKTEQ